LLRRLKQGLEEKKLQDFYEHQFKYQKGGAMSSLIPQRKKMHELEKVSEGTCV
jgi:hypothetical protein